MFPLSKVTNWTSSGQQSDWINLTQTLVISCSCTALFTEYIKFAVIKINEPIVCCLAIYYVHIVRILSLDSNTTVKLLFPVPWNWDADCHWILFSGEQKNGWFCTQSSPICKILRLGENYIMYIHKTLRLLHLENETLILMTFHREILQNKQL